MLKMHFISVLLALLGFGTQLWAQESKPLSGSIESITLTPEDCALFVWVGFPSRLLFISHPRERIVYSAQNGIQQYSLSPNRGKDKFDQYPSQDLLDGRGLASQLRLGDPVEMSEFIFYKSGTATLQAPDGWLRIENAKAVSACNTAALDSFINFEESSRSFNAPPWLKTPTQLAEIDSRQLKLIPVSEDLPEPQVTLETARFASIDTEKIREKNPEPDPVNQNLPAKPIAHPIDLHMVQLGAFPSAARAQDEWVSFQQDFEYLRERQHVLQLADIEGLGIVYRLRVTGFPDRGDAIDFCSRLKSDGVDCFVPIMK